MDATFEIRNGVLHVAVTGTYGPAEALENRTAIARWIKETGVRLGIVDLRNATIAQTTLDIYEINTSLDEHIPKDVRFAFVYSPDTLSHELATFSENVLVNSGYDAKVCTDMDEAMQWLKEQA